jgi:hypothetical protein
VQSPSQPSPSVVLPSSHCSTLAVPDGSHDVSRAPLPHFGATNGHAGSRPQPMRSCPFWFQWMFLPSGYGPALAKNTGLLPVGVVKRVDAVAPSNVGCVSSDWM